MQAKTGLIRSLTRWRRCASIAPITGGIRRRRFTIGLTFRPLAPKVATLRGVIHHRSVRSLGDQLHKLNRYSDQQAQDLEDRGIAIPTWRVFFEFPAAFVKAYFSRGHGKKQALLDSSQR